MSSMHDQHTIDTLLDHLIFTPISFCIFSANFFSSYHSRIRVLICKKNLTAVFQSKGICDCLSNI